MKFRTGKAPTYAQKASDFAKKLRLTKTAGWQSAKRKEKG
jgi:hypothetical protein